MRAFFPVSDYWVFVAGFCFVLNKAEQKTCEHLNSTICPARTWSDGDGVFAFLFLPG